MARVFFVSGAGMGFLFGIGTAFFAFWIILRFVPRMIGLSVWMSSAGITGGAALVVLYLLDAN